MNSSTIINNVRNRENLSFQDKKISYMLLKPNAVLHYEGMINQIERNNFEILAQYAIFDYDTVNMALHQNQPSAMKYIIPISHMYKDFYSNYAILLIIGKNNITYENFSIQVVQLKQILRAKYNLPYISYVFNTSLIGQKNEKQKIIIKDVDGNSMCKERFNEEGTYMLFFTNEVHSPDADLKSMVDEIELLYSMGIIDDRLLIPKSIIHNICRYRTFEFLKDLQ